MNVYDLGWGAKRAVTFGQLDPASLTASVPEAPATSGLAGLSYYKLAVGAGLSVWLLTKILDDAFFKKAKGRR